MFTQHFRNDLYSVFARMFGDDGVHPSPFAFTRYADGEHALMFDRRFESKRDKWQWKRDEPHPYKELLREAFSSDLAGWHIGVPCRCHDEECRNNLLPLTRVPQDQITFATLFIFGNWRAVQGNLYRLKADCQPISRFTDRRIPRDGISMQWDGYKEIAKDLSLNKENDRRPIIVSAGPLANLIIYEYWKLTASDAKLRKRRRTIVDMGSSIDVLFTPRKSRRYQTDGHPSAQEVCTW